MIYQLVHINSIHAFLTLRFITLINVIIIRIKGRSNPHTINK